ncbi:hypothetical protein L1887_23158 [Cichorium endivia]|nr:hypothetical protein L1887_23158 [Cichorium endivia]
MESESNLIPILESKSYFIAAEKDLVEARTDMIPTVADVQTSSMKAHEGSDEIIVDQNPYDAAIPTIEYIDLACVLCTLDKKSLVNALGISFCRNNMKFIPKGDAPY